MMAASGTKNSPAAASNTNLTSTETTMTASAPWETGASSSLDRAEGSAEDLMAQMGAAQEGGLLSAGPNAVFDGSGNGVFRPASKLPKAPTSTRESSATSKSSASHDDDKQAQQVATANIKYKNQSGRAAILAHSTVVHHDFGALTSILNVTLPSEAIAELKRNPDVEWVDVNGAVYFVQPWRH